LTTDDLRLHVLSVRQLADEDGHVVQRYDYDPFGQVLVAEGTHGSVPRYTREHLG
jgi:hypothetical protein